VVEGKKGEREPDGEIERYREETGERKRWNERMKIRR
jgi:hypothetical protein